MERSSYRVGHLSQEFYDSFQEKLQGSTLYVLTIASVTIMPIQLMTGIFGMNFTWQDPGTGSPPLSAAAVQMPV
jgi:Mg2+ and Co2+ transporter CorA